MNNADIQTELERIMAQSTSIKELADKNSEKIQKLIDEARVASNEGDTEMYLTLMNEATAELALDYAKYLKNFHKNVVVMDPYGAIEKML